MKTNPQCTAASLQTAAIDLVKNDELNGLCMTARNFDLKRIAWIGANFCICMNPSDHNL